MPHEISLIRQIVHYFKRPTSVVKDEIKTISFIKKFINIVRIWGLEIVISLLFSLILSVFLSLAHYDESQHAITQFLEQNSAIALLLFGTIYAPFMEELTFRLGLKFSPFRFGLSVSFLSSFLIQTLDAAGVLKVTELFTLIGIENPIITLILFFILSVLVGIVIGIFIKILNLGNVLEKIHNKIFVLLYYLSAIIFGFAHISNYEGVQSIWFLIPILGLPQIFIGMVLGYVRVNYGLGWSMLLHSLHNGLAMLPLVILSFGPNTLRLLVNNTNSLSTNDITNSFTNIDYLVIVIAFAYVMFLILVVLTIWIQVLIEVYKERNRI